MGNTSGVIFNQSDLEYTYLLHNKTEGPISKQITSRVGGNLGLNAIAAGPRVVVGGNVSRESQVSMEYKETDWRI